MNPENLAYLQAKRDQMRHLLQLDSFVDLSLDAPQEARPRVTLSYAQSLDGSITVTRGQPLALSGPQSMAMTHRLRADHDVILIGIGTLLADDPSLTVRLVEGRNPQPIVLDSQLRFPLDAKLWRHPTHKPWIATVGPADPARKAALTAQGATIFELPADKEGKVSLPDLMVALGAKRVQRIMVEGGACVITEFLLQRLVDRVIITVAPMFVGGLNAVGSLRGLNGDGLPSLQNSSVHRLGQDMVLVGDVAWGRRENGETAA